MRYSHLRYEITSILFCALHELSLIQLGGITTAYATGFKHRYHEIQFIRTILALDNYVDVMSYLQIFPIEYTIYHLMHGTKF